MSREQESYSEIDPVEKSLEILSKYPLCDHCLGRLFARMGLELGNDERGRAIKTLLSMKLHTLLKKGLIGRNELRVYTLNAGDPVSRLYAKIYDEKVSPRQCYICSNKLSRRYFEEHASRIKDLLRKYDASTFLIGVSIPQELMLREIEVAEKIGLETSESIKNEIKREIGKVIKEKYGFVPDFDHPDIVVIINYVSDDYNIVVNPILLEGVYWKRGRNISHTVWISRTGVKQYPYSLEEFLNERLKPVFNAERIIHHASGREDVDARMLGTGRPLVVEIKNPRKRRVEMEQLNSILETLVLEVKLVGKSSRTRIEYLKGEGSKKAKIYKILFYTSNSISDEDIKRLENELSNRLITQRTPTRILRRKKDYVRKRRVYSVKVKRLTNNLFEAIVWCDGGLYVKELVHCDNGRTTPCFSEILGVDTYPLELDVIGVEIE